MSMLLESAGGLKIVLPEPTSPITVRKSIEWETKKEEGSTAYSQKYKGYTLAQITLYWELSKDKEDVYELMERIEKVYSHIENGKPAVWKVVDKFLNAQGIKYVVAKDWEATEEVKEELIRITLVLMEQRPKEIEKEKKSAKKGGGGGEKKAETKAEAKAVKSTARSHPCEKEGSLARSECRKLYVRWRKEKEEAARQGKSFPDFKTWVKSQPVSPASDDEA